MANGVAREYKLRKDGFQLLDFSPYKEDLNRQKKVWKKECYTNLRIVDIGSPSLTLWGKKGKCKKRHG